MAPDAQSPAQARTESGALTLPPRPSRYDAEYDGTGPYRGRFGPRREREKGSVHSASGAQAALGTCFGSRGSQVRILSPRLDQHEPSSRMRRGFRWSWPRGDGIRTCTGVDEVRDGRTRSGRTLCGQAEPYGRGSQVRILSPRLDQHEPSSRMRRGFRWSWPRGDGIRSCTGVDEVRDGRTRSGRTLCGQAEPYGRGSHCSTTGSNPPRCAWTCRGASTSRAARPGTLPPTRPTRTLVANAAGVSLVVAKGRLGSNLHRRGRSPRRAHAERADPLRAGGAVRQRVALLHNGVESCLRPGQRDRCGPSRTVSVRHGARPGRTAEGPPG